MPRTNALLAECDKLTREARIALEGVVAGLVFVRKVDCTSGCLPGIADSLKEQCDVVKAVVDDLKDCLDELAD